jgi:hypothetical protein
MVCRNCGQGVDPEHPFCPWCASPQRRKSVAMFAAHPEVDAPGRGLRVSRYFDPADGPPHTRLSVYDDVGRVHSVIALDDDTTYGVGRFLLALGASAPDRSAGRGSLRGRLGRLRFPLLTDRRHPM